MNDKSQSHIPFILLIWYKNTRKTPEIRYFFKLLILLLNITHLQSKRVVLYKQTECIAHTLRTSNRPAVSPLK